MTVRNFLFLFLFSFCSMLSAADSTKLFERTDLAQWNFHTEQEGVPVQDVFSFTKEGILTCKGQPFGWLGTKEKYKNFRLSVEYRWIGEPTNSGVFLRLNAQPKNTFLPRCFEVQLKHENNGDLYGFHGMKLRAPDGAAERFSERDGGEKFGQINGLKKIADAEAAPGTWNSLEILCDGGLIVIVVNGKFVNWGLDAEQNEGFIAFQSEGGSVEFRNAIVKTNDEP